MKVRKEASKHSITDQVSLHLCGSQLTLCLRPFFFFPSSYNCFIVKTFNIVNIYTTMLAEYHYLLTKSNCREKQEDMVEKNLRGRRWEAKRTKERTRKKIGTYEKPWTKTCHSWGFNWGYMLFNVVEYEFSCVYVCEWEREREFTGEEAEDILLRLFIKTCVSTAGGSWAPPMGQQLQAWMHGFYKCSHRRKHGWININQMQRYPVDIDVCADALKGTSVFQGVAILPPIIHVISKKKQRNLFFVMTMI